jgi:hypothetical protein
MDGSERLIHRGLAKVIMAIALNRPQSRVVPLNRDFGKLADLIFLECRTTSSSFQWLSNGQHAASADLP